MCVCVSRAFILENPTPAGAEIITVDPRYDARALAHITSCARTAVRAGEKQFASEGERRRFLLPSKRARE